MKDIGAQSYFFLAVLHLTIGVSIVYEGRVVEAPFLKGNSNTPENGYMVIDVVEAPFLKGNSNCQHHREKDAALVEAPFLKGNSNKHLIVLNF